MNKKLPNVYANPIAKKIANVQETYYGSFHGEKPKSTMDVGNMIDSIFSSRNFVYKSNVFIETVNESFECILVGKTPSSLLTMDGKVIPISSILRIEKK